MRPIVNSTSRDLKIAKKVISKLELDLTGLVVLTECASGPYAYTPVISLLAGASRVICVGKDSRFGTFDENKHNIQQILKSTNVEGKASFFKNEVPLSLLPDVDIITNSGQLRPIGSKVILSLKSTAVLPLMWETWEFRPEDLDLTSCQVKGIPVIGTNEDYEKIKLFDYDGILALKLLLELGIEVHNNVVLLVGSGIVGRQIGKVFEKLGVEYFWLTEYGNEKSDKCIGLEHRDKVLEIDHLDAVIFAELEYKQELVGRQNGLLTFGALESKFGDVRIGHISGNIDLEELQNCGLQYLPENIRPIGYISYSLDEIGTRPVIELMAAGLKVGEISSRTRMEGGSVESAIAKTVTHGIGQDFEGGFFNYG